ncbi:hypothetical protein ACNTMW_04025 [Planosporangium sp. 12N6]
MRHEIVPHGVFSVESGHSQVRDTPVQVGVDTGIISAKIADLLWKVPP